jgi:hypothetical protein
MNGINASSDAVWEKLETAPNKFTACSLSSWRPCKCVLITPQSIPSGIYTWRNAMFLAIPDASQEQISSKAMTERERAHRFSASSIDELNGHRKTRYGSTKNFVLLLAGLAALLLLLYLQIVW